MTFNLIQERWIPIRRQDGTQELIRPCDVTDNLEDNPVTALNAPRPDFNGALIQFLIGLAQTTMTPEHESEWRGIYKNPPSPAELQSKFETVQHAFNLDGDGPRFMQDIELDQSGGSKPISSLLIESPGEKTLRDRNDFFIKRGQVSSLCYGCVASALFTVQTNSPAAGAGYRTSIRGGGPLTTLIIQEGSIWSAIWLNILNQIQAQTLGGDWAKNNESCIFPWLASIRTSEPKTGKITTPEDAHPCQVFWGIPKRILISPFEDQKKLCDLCGRDDLSGVSDYYTKPYGVNYEGPWRHPLTPYSSDKDQIPLPKKGEPGGISYRHWVGLVSEEQRKDIVRKPASVVHYFKQEREKKSDFRLWAFGYDMDNMKARCWYEGEMPLVFPKDSNKNTSYENLTQQLVESAYEVLNILRGSIKKAWFGDHADSKTNFSFLNNAFWTATEAGFYRCLARICECLDNNQDTLQARQGWVHHLAGAAERLFEEHCLSSPVEEKYPKRVALAWKYLRDKTNPAFNKKLREILDLPKPDSKEKAKQPVTT